MRPSGIAGRGAVGVDIGGHGVKVVRVDSLGAVLSRARAPLRSVVDREITHVEGTVSALVDQLDPSGALPVGIGIPGFHDDSAGVLRQSPNFPGWEEQPVAQRLRALLQRPVATGNDANCALLGEAWTGAAAGLRDVVMLTLGTGVGSAFLVGGRLVTGARGAGAEAGHITLHRGGRLCGCERRGCLERYVSGPGLLETARAEHALDGAGPVPPSAHDVFLSTAPWASRAISRFASDLADGLVQLVHIFSPAAIVLGGGVASSFDRFAPEVESAIAERAIPACLAGVLPLRAASLGGDAGAVGAARLVLTRSTDDR